MNQEMINGWINMATSYAPKVLGALIALVLGFWVIGMVTRSVGKIMDKRDFDLTLRPFIKSLVSVGLKVMLLLSVAGMFGFETTSFIAVLSALVFAIGLALQGSLSHFASGVLLLVFKPYKVGDLVELSGKVGVVEGIQIFNTLLRTPDNKSIIIPNGVVTSGIITNISGQGELRVDMTFGISYNADIDVAKKVIREVADGCPWVLNDKPVDIFVKAHNASSVDFAVRPWAKSEHFWDVNYYMHEQIKKAFDKNNIGIPFPQMDIHMKQN